MWTSLTSIMCHEQNKHMRKQCVPGVPPSSECLGTRLLHYIPQLYIFAKTCLIHYNSCYVLHLLLPYKSLPPTGSIRSSETLRSEVTPMFREHIQFKMTLNNIIILPDMEDQFWHYCQSEFQRLKHYLVC